MDKSPPQPDRPSDKPDPSTNAPTRPTTLPAFPMNSVWPLHSGLVLNQGLFFDNYDQAKRTSVFDAAFLGFPQFSENYDMPAARDNPFLPATWQYPTATHYQGVSDYHEAVTANTQTEARSATKRARVVQPQNKEDKESSEGSVRSPLTAEICAGRGCSHEARFALREQPKPKQRKSYKNENRYLLPNPTQVLLSEWAKGDRGVRVTKATCTVKLLDGSGNRLARQASYYLEDVEEGLTKELDVTHGAFDFSLKVRQNSGPDKFRLCFSINYGTSDGLQHKEKVISSPFLVQSNKSFFSKDPKVKAIHPCVGTHAKPNEVWIKGRDFNEKGVCVKIDGVEAVVTEVQPNFIIAMTPARTDLTASRTVAVSVANIFKQKVVDSEQELQYTYLVAPANGLVHCDVVFKPSAQSTNQNET